MRTPINLAIKLITLICVIFRDIYKEVRLIPASILTMSKQIGTQFLKRKLSSSSEMQQTRPFSYADVVKQSDVQSAKAPPQSGSSHGKNSGQGNHNRQGPRGRDDIRNAQPPHTSFQSRKSSSSSDDRNRPQGQHGPHHSQHQQPYDKSAKHSYNQSWNSNQSSNRGRKRGNKGGHWVKGKGHYESSQTSQVYNENRNHGYDKSSGSGSEYQVSDFSADHRQESQTMHHQSSTTNTPQRSRQNSDSNAWSGKSSSLPVMMSHSSDSSSKSPCSESTVSHSLLASEENQASNLPPEFPPLSDLTSKPLAATPMKSLSLSNPPAGSKSKAETMSSPTQSKKPPGWSGPDPGTEGRKKSGPKNTAQGNAVLTDTKTVESQEPGKGKGVWKGVGIEELRRAPECFSDRVTLEAVDESADLHSDRPESQEQGRKFVVPPSFVFLPHHQQPGISGPSPRWNKIAQLLSNQITNLMHLEYVMAEIMYHNPHHNPQNNRYHGSQSNPYEAPDFHALEAYFQTLTPEQYNQFFYETLPRIQNLVLELPYLFEKPLLILKQRANLEVTLSQHQVACLLANAFFNTFPERFFNQNERKPLQMPDINFINLYTKMKSERKVEKLKCIVHYFERVTTDMPNGNLTYKRVYRQPEDWLTMEKKLTKLHVSTEGTIEDERGFLQADFANKFVGGGVLNTGLVQEEIRFVLCPEMIVSRLITEMLTNDEVLVMIGCERFSSYSGYSDSFKFTGRFDDETKSDEHGRKYTEVVAMDASVFKTDFYEQFKMHHVTRELNKAHCAFKGSGVRNLPAVCTGNWGCGAFGGCTQLKALIQLMAASVANRDICYLTFGDAELCLQIGHIYDILKTRNMSIKDIMEILTLYSKSKTYDSLFTFMEKTIYGDVHTAEKPIKPQEKSTKSDFPKNNKQQEKPTKSDFTKNTNVKGKSPNKHNK